MLKYGNRSKTQKIKVAWTHVQNGTEKDSHDGLNMESFRQKKTGKAKMTLSKTFEGNFKKMVLTWEMAKRAKQKKEFHGEKGVAALS